MWINSQGLFLSPLVIEDEVIKLINDEITAQTEVGVFENAQTQAEVAEEEDAE